MSETKSLEEIVDEERLDPNSPEMKAITTSRKAIEDLIRGEYGYEGLSIRYGGSKAKGTILKCEHDADLLVYFHRDNDVAGKTLREIYEAIGTTLNGHYAAEPGTTSWKVHALVGTARRYLKVDVVAGRFIDGNEGDVFLHQKSGEKDYMLTNPEKHISHVTESGLVPALCGLKLWRIKNGIRVKQFPFELMCIDLMSDLRRRSLEDQVYTAIQRMGDMARAPRVVDPANSNNDVTKALNLAWSEIRQTASDALNRMDNGWADVLGMPPEAASDEKLYDMASAVAQPTKPWSH